MEGKDRHRYVSPSRVGGCCLRFGAKEVELHPRASFSSVNQHYRPVAFRHRSAASGYEPAPPPAGSARRGEPGPRTSRCRSSIAEKRRNRPPFPFSPRRPSGGSRPGGPSPRNRAPAPRQHPAPSLPPPRLTCWRPRLALATRGSGRCRPSRGLALSRPRRPPPRGSSRRPGGGRLPWRRRGLPPARGRRRPEGPAGGAGPAPLRAPRPLPGPLLQHSSL